MSVLCNMLRVKRIDIVWAVLGIMVANIIGYDLQFAYEENDRSIAIAFFCPVNQSAWEQLKLIFLPNYIWLLTSLLIWFRDDFDGNINAIGSFALATACGMFIGMIYTLSMFHSDEQYIVSNFINYVVANVIVHVCTVWLFPRVSILSPDNIYYSVIVYSLLHIAFPLFTFYPPHVDLFRDFTTGTYGVLPT